MLKNGEEWAVEEMDGLPILGIKTINGSRMANKDELERAVNYLNEFNVYSVKIYCRNEQCKDKGGWIVRSVDDIKRTAYNCESCHHPMIR